MKLSEIKKMKLPIKENDIKLAIKDYLAVLGIFNYPLLQALGSYKGIPDRVLHINGKVIYLEIKKPGGKMSQFQLDFQSQCRHDDIDYWCISSIEELSQCLKDIAVT